MNSAGHIKPSERLGAEGFGKAKSGSFADGITLLLGVTTDRWQDPSRIPLLVLFFRRQSRTGTRKCFWDVLWPRYRPERDTCFSGQGLQHLHNA